MGKAKKLISKIVYCFLICLPSLIVVWAILYGIHQLATVVNNVRGVQ